MGKTRPTRTKVHAKLVQMHGFGVSVDEGASAHGILRDYLANLDGDIGGGG